MYCFLAQKLHSTNPTLSYRPYEDSLLHWVSTCIQHNAREAVRRMGPSAAAFTSKASSGKISPGLLIINLTVINFIKKYTHTRLTALCPGLPGWAGTRKVKPIWILLKQKTASGSGISWAICKSARRSRQITTPAYHHSSFLQVGCPSCRPTNSVKALKAQEIQATQEQAQKQTSWNQIILPASVLLCIARSQQ